MQTLRKLSSKKSKFEGLQLGEVVSKNKYDNSRYSISNVITHTEPIVSSNKISTNKRAEKIVNAIQKRYDNTNTKKLLNKEPDIQSPIISIKLVRNENLKNEKKVSQIKPKLASPTPLNKTKTISFDKKFVVSPIKPKLISPIQPKSILKRTSSQNRKNRSFTPSDNKVTIKYNIIPVRTILKNYQMPLQTIINDNRYKTYMRYNNLYKNMNNLVDRFILTNISNGIRFV
jgi:hypothetical protein